MRVKLLLAAMLFGSVGGCIPMVHGVHAIQQATDTPSVWVEIKTDDEKANGVYRCTDDGKNPPVCKKAQLVQ